MGKNNHAQKVLDKTLQDIELFVRKSKTVREQNNFKKKQLQFLKADVKKPKIPFKRILLKLDRKKARKEKNQERKRNKVQMS